MPEPARFLCDDSLLALARRLRVLGHDVECVRGGRLDELVAVAARAGRVVLTRSQRIAGARDAGGVLTMTGDLEQDVRRIAGLHVAASPRFARCTMCNAPLAARSAFEARGEVPGRVLRTASAFRSCTQCGRWYWQGTHAARLQAWFDRVLGRPGEAPRAG